MSSVPGMPPAPGSRTARLVMCLFIGFSSGLPLYLLFNLLPAWLKQAQIDIKTIGLFALIQLPYTWKFLWSPLIDRYLPLSRWLGRRRGWILLTQIVLTLGTALLGLLRPEVDLFSIILLSSAIALFSATQDIAIDAYRRELLQENELGLGTALHVNAYRIAQLVPGSLALILSDHLPWFWVFVVCSAFMLPGILATLCAPPSTYTATPPRTLAESVVGPFRELLARLGPRGIAQVVMFLLCYKLGSSMATALATPFYIDLGFSRTEIGLIAKNVGLLASVGGGLLGVWWMLYLPIRRALFYFGIFQLLSLFTFVWLSWFQGRQAGSDPTPLLEGLGLTRGQCALGLAVGLETLGVGLTTAAFTAWITHIAHPRYSATQLALFTSLEAVPRALFSASAGFLVDRLGWTHYFWFCVLLSLPGLLLIYFLRKQDGIASAPHTTL